MRRPKFIPAGQVEYRGHVIGLTPSGKISCDDLAITADTLDEVKAAIRAAEKKIAKLPKIPVWFRTQWEDNFIQGETSGRRSGWNRRYVRVNWKNARGDRHHDELMVDDVYPVTPESEKQMEAYTAMHKQKVELEAAMRKLLSEIESLDKKEE